MDGLEGWWGAVFLRGRGLSFVQRYRVGCVEFFEEPENSLGL